MFHRFRRLAISMLAAAALALMTIAPVLAGHRWP
jgi:hypothetical protein